jgi:hypothetical protein
MPGRASNLLWYMGVKKVKKYIVKLLCYTNKSEIN